MKIMNVGGIIGGDAYLLMTDRKTALIDSGFAFSADKMIENIKNALKGRPLDYVILTHSHYDHASGSAYCKSEWENVKIIASEYTAKIFSKKSAIDVMRELNDSAAAQRGFDAYPDKLDSLAVDITVRDGDIIDLGDVTLKVIAAPGHTKCSVAFYCEEEKLLISCETMGVYITADLVMPCYLVGYEMSLDFIRRVQKLAVEKILPPHGEVLSGIDCKKFLENALFWNEEAKNRIVTGYLSGKTVPQLIADFRDLFYQGEIKNIQPEKAFELNASYLVPMIIRECIGG